MNIVSYMSYVASIACLGVGTNYYVSSLASIACLRVGPNSYVRLVASKASTMCPKAICHFNSAAGHPSNDDSGSPVSIDTSPLSGHQPSSPCNQVPGWRKNNINGQGIIYD